MDLFGKVTRDERQEQCRVTWIKNKCKGSIQACTGSLIFNILIPVKF